MAKSIEWLKHTSGFMKRKKNSPFFSHKIYIIQINDYILLKYKSFELKIRGLGYRQLTIFEIEVAFHSAYIRASEALL